MGRYARERVPVAFGLPSALERIAERVTRSEGVCRIVRRDPRVCVAVAFFNIVSKATDPRILTTFFVFLASYPDSSS